MGEVERQYGDARTLPILLLSAEQFAREFVCLRGMLEKSARKRGCDADAAQDLACDVACYALQRLEQFDVATGLLGLQWWLEGILGILIKRYRAEQARTILLSSIPDHSLPIPPPSRPIADREWLQYLPRHLRSCVRLHLDGYNQMEIADEAGIHRNTVRKRLEEANLFARTYLGEISLAFFDELTRYATYTPPPGLGKLWKCHHPPDLLIRLDSFGSVLSIRRRANR